MNLQNPSAASNVNQHNGKADIIKGSITGHELGIIVHLNQELNEALETQARKHEYEKVHKSFIIFFLFTYDYYYFLFNYFLFIYV